MRLGLTIHEIYDGCGPPSDKATKGRRLLILSLSLPLTHLSTAIYRYFACIP